MRMHVTMGLDTRSHGNMKLPCQHDQATSSTPPNKMQVIRLDRLYFSPSPDDDGNDHATENNDRKSE